METGDCGTTVVYISELLCASEVEVEAPEVFSAVASEEDAASVEALGMDRVTIPTVPLVVATGVVDEDRSVMAGLCGSSGDIDGDSIKVFEAESGDEEVGVALGELIDEG